MDKKLGYQVTDLYKEYMRKFLAWREFYTRGIQLNAFGIDIVWKNMERYASLMDVMLRIGRSNEAEKKRGNHGI